MFFLDNKLFSIIIAFLPDPDKISLLMTNTKAYDNRHSVQLTQSYTYSVIKNHWSYPQIKKLIFDYNIEIKEQLLPKNLTHLTFFDSFNKMILYPLPQTLTHLTFGRDFNQIITSKIMNNVQVLKFGKKFNQPLFYLPNNHMREITYCIPFQTRKLIFGEEFNQPLASMRTKNHEIVLALHNNIEKIIFGRHFKYPIKNLLPINLTHLTISLSAKEVQTELPSGIFLTNTYAKDMKFMIEEFKKFPTSDHKGNGGFKILTDGYFDFYDGIGEQGEFLNMGLLRAR